jgi:transposase-like protein
MVAEVRPDYPSEWSAMKALAAKLGVTSTETVRSWVRRAEGGGGFLRGRARPATQVLIAFIDAFRKVYGVEPIYRVLSALGRSGGSCSARATRWRAARLST